MGRDATQNDTRIFLAQNTTTMRTQVLRRLLAGSSLVSTATCRAAPCAPFRGCFAPCSTSSSTPSRRDIRAGLDELDDPFTKGKQKKRVSLPLEEEAPVVAHPADDAIEAIKSDYVDALNDVLTDKSLLGVFKGFRLPSQLLEVVEVQFDRQQSHIIAFWKADFVEKLQSATEEDREKYARTAQKIAKHINDTMNSHEGRVRTALMQRGSFRRVPRVEFRCVSEKKADYLSPARISSLLKQIQEE